MSSTHFFDLNSVVQQALKLPVPERVEVLHRLWESLPADSGSVFLSEDLLQELDRRAAYEDDHPDDELTWEEVKAGVRRQQ
ncbi:MAG: addiction module protein [Planctomycetes bacterium]|nr:addiction module protein [Planctomycetota bacterium]